MADLRKVAKAVTSVIKQDVLPAEERAANLAKMLEGSKVKERLYHATPADIAEFKPGGNDPTLSGPAIWMTPNAENQPAAHNIKRVPGQSGRVYRGSQFTPGTNVMPLYANIKNPLISTEETWKSDFAKVGGGSPWVLSPEEVASIRAAGHDGVFYYDKNGKLTEVLAFQPEQVKSAIGNRGTYDVTKKDITKAKGGRMAGGGIAKAAKALTSMIQDTLPAAERKANLDKLLEPSKVKERLYHSTTATEGGKGAEAIRRLKPSKDGSLGSGVYLTPSSARSSHYSGSPSDEALAMMLVDPYQQDAALRFLNRRSTGNVLPEQVGGNMLPVYAQIKNPLVLEGKGDPMIEALMKLGLDEAKASRMVERAYENKGYIGREVETRARAAGYDGLMQYRDGKLSEVVSYNPNAVKSATGNRGTYDINDPELSRRKGGSVKMAGGGGSFYEQFEAALRKHGGMAAGGPADTRPDVTDGGNIIQDSAFAKGGQIKFKGLRNRKKFDKGGIAFSDPLSAPDAPVDPKVRSSLASTIDDVRKALEREFALIKDPKTRADIMKRIGLQGVGSFTSIPGTLMGTYGTLKEEATAPVMRLLGKKPRTVEGAIGEPMAEALSGDALIEEAKRRGMVGEAEAPILETATGLVAPFAAAPAARVAKAAPRAAKGLVNAMVEPVNPRLAQRGAITWHGSPHRFPPTEKNPLGEFDPTKIGSGEGAQAYGYGHYVAESPEVAKGYRQRLSDINFLVDDKRLVGPSSQYGKINPRQEREKLSMPERMATYALDGFIKQGVQDPVKSAIAHLQRFGKNKAETQEAIDIVNKWAAQGAKTEAGALYKIDIPDEQIAKMLDWDKPLSEQPKTLQEIAKAKDPNLASKEPHFVTPTGDVIHWSDLLNSAEELKNPKLRAIAPKVLGGQWVEYGDYMMKKTTGEDFYRNLSAPSEWQETSSVLRELGIPGIRYLDRASRASGKGTSNFVVFPGNESMMKIIERQKRGGLAQVKGR